MTASGLHEVLGDTGSVDGAIEGKRSIHPRIVARRKSPFRATTGATITPEGSLEDDSADVLIVCDIHLPPDESPQGRWRDEIAWVRSHIEHGAIVCATCSGSVLLAEAGLLDGADAASHWMMAGLFRDRYPTVRFRPERILCDSGRGGQLITTGGASAWQDLALYLIARLCGATEAARIARLYLLGDRGFGQLPFASMTRPRMHSDAVISQIQTWLVDHYATAHPVSVMVKKSGLSERSFKRRFSVATGYSPVGYVQALRIEEAKQMLEADSQSIDDIAATVGYEDPAFFRRLFKRTAGITPTAYRQRTRTRGMSKLTS